jgi:hypothetical protein
MFGLSTSPLGVLVALSTLISVSAAKNEFQVGDFVRRHLNSIRTAQDRAAVKNRAAEGKVSFEVLSRDSENQNGTQTFHSEDNELFSALKLPNPSLTIRAGIGYTDVRTAGRQDEHYRLEERFADFMSVENLMLPTRWTIQFSINSVSQFEVTGAKIVHNIQLDPKNFESQVVSDSTRQPVSWEPSGATLV